MAVQLPAPKVAFGFGLALLVLVVAGSAAIFNAVRLGSLFRWIDHTHQVLRHVDLALNAGLRMQAGMRSYVVTGREEAATVFERATADCQQEIASVRALTRDNPTQQQRLAALTQISAALERSLSDRIAERRAHGEAAVANPTALTAQQAVDDFRSALRVLADEENALMTDRLARTRSVALVSAWLAAIATLAGAVTTAVAAILIARDQRARIAAEAAARETALRFETLYNEAPCGYHSFDAGLVFTAINATELRWLRRTRDEVVGRLNLIDCLTPESAALFRDHVPTLLAGGQVAELELSYRREDGTVIPVVINAEGVCDEAGQFLTGRATVFDNSIRHAAQQAVRESEERLRLMFSGVQDYGIVMLDPDGRVIQWNAGAERLLGYTEDQILGQNFSRFYPPELAAAGAAERELKVAAETGRFEEEGWRVRHDGSRFWAHVVVSPLRVGTELRGFVKVTRDLTERRRTEQRIQQLNTDLRRRAAELEATNRELEAFSYSVSHDLRAPLRHIDGFAGLLAGSAGSQLDAEARHYLDSIARAAVRMGKLIDDLLSFSRTARTPLRLAPVDMNKLVAGVIADGQFDAAVPKIRWSIATLPPAHGDAALLRLVWANLISNAVKYSGKQPEPHIQVEGRHDAEADEFVFSIRDNGVGFDMAYAANLFGVFQRLHAASEFEGTGIGLANVRRIVERHGGRAWADSRVGAGATFSFSLPANPAPTAAAVV